jgi:hypothetical protein
MILRAPRKPVKRRSPRKLPLPNKNSSLFINRAAGLAKEKARLHVCMQTVSSGSV